MMLKIRFKSFTVGTIPRLKPEQSNTTKYLFCVNEELANEER